MPINIDNYKAVLNKIDADPSGWRQRVWHLNIKSCGTTACFGGHAQILSGKEANVDTAEVDAMEWLGLTKAQACYLFSPDRTLEELKAEIVFDAGGFNPRGFDREGFDRDGCPDRLDGDGYDLY